MPDNSHMGLLGPSACWVSPSGPLKPNSSNTQLTSFTPDLSLAPNSPASFPVSSCPQLSGSEIPSCSSISLPTPYGGLTDPLLLHPDHHPFPKWSLPPRLSPRSQLPPHQTASPAYIPRQGWSSGSPRQTHCPHPTPLTHFPALEQARPAPTSTSWQSGRSASV